MRVHYLLAVGALCSLIDVAAAAPAGQVGVHCRIDALTFDGDPDLSRIDYVIPPAGKPPRFRLLAMHADDQAGAVSVELKTYGTVSATTTPLSLEPVWKSVVKLPGQRDIAVTTGDASFSHFEPHGDGFAAGTIQFATVDGHRGECRFRLSMEVVDLSSGIPR